MGFMMVLRQVLSPANFFTLQMLHGGTNRPISTIYDIFNDAVSHPNSMASNGRIKSK
jgi:ABC-type bacteriocin/lantibiotic exporter with double-glycine peptidase domain